MTPVEIAALAYINSKMELQKAINQHKVYISIFGHDKSTAQVLRVNIGGWRENVQVCYRELKYQVTALPCLCG